jgi:outer membrane protein TolC
MTTNRSIVQFTCGLLVAGVCSAQTALSPNNAASGARVTFAAAASAGSGSQAPNAGPLTITLQDALDRARANEPQFRSAQTEAAVARQDVVQARAALLPSVNYTTAYLYTEGGAGGDVPRFIANNTVHEYIAQGNAHESLNVGPGGVAEYRRATAAASVARAKAEIATRGLVVTVVQTYYGLVVAERKYANAQLAATEAQNFLTRSRQLERGGEVAHSDVIKAQIQANDRDRDLREAQFEMQKSRLELAVLLFPKFDQDFTVVDDMRLAPVLPPMNDVEQLAAKNNPNLRAALSALDVANREVTVARSGHLPTLTMDYWYGIDANHFATRSDGVRNLGYSAAATLEVPIWNWGATQSKVKQAVLRRTQAQVELSFAQREAIANLRAFYAEADAARSESEKLRQSADLAAESLRLTSMRYQAGEATALEVVDAQNTLVQARNAFDDGEARYRVALANLQTLTGNF